MELSREEEVKAYTHALAALATAMAFQLDPIRLFADLKALANVHERAGDGPSAGLIDELARAVELRVLARRPSH